MLGTKQSLFIIEYSESAYLSLYHIFTHVQDPHMENQ